MKLIKMIFSRFFLMALLFFAQVFLYWYLFSFFYDYVTVFKVIATVIIFITFFSIINRKETPEFKLPWLFLVMALPVFGTMIYVFFAHPRSKKKESKAFRRSEMEAGPYTSLTPEEQAKNKAFLGEYNGVANYLSQTAHLNGRLDNNVKFYPVGELLWQDLLEELKKAEHFIFMEYFIIHPGKMWDSIHSILLEKVKEGVEVRVMYDDIGSISVLPAWYCRKLRKEGIRAHKFNPFRPIMSGIFNNRDHRKITVIDGKVAFTGGLNIGDEYINKNHRLGHWKDTGVRIRGTAVNNLTTLFLQSYDTMSKTKTKFDNYYVTEHETFEGGGYTHVFGTGPKPYYKEQIGENNYLNMINAAKRYVYITTPYLIVDHAMLTAISNAAKRGVDVRVITPKIPDKRIVFNMTRSNFPYLMESGVHIYEYTPGFIHAKMLVADDEAAFVGTINLDYRSFTHHYECGAVLYKAPCVLKIKEDIEQTFAVSNELTRKTFKQSKFARLINSFLKIFSPLL